MIKTIRDGGTRRASYQHQDFAGDSSMSSMFVSAGRKPDVTNQTTDVSRGRYRDRCQKNVPVRYRHRFRRFDLFTKSLFLSIHRKRRPACSVGPGRSLALPPAPPVGDNATLDTPLSATGPRPRPVRAPTTHNTGDSSYGTHSNVKSISSSNCTNHAMSASSQAFPSQTL